MKQPDIAEVFCVASYGAADEFHSQNGKAWD
jgi:hypothetical protein